MGIEPEVIPLWNQGISTLVRRISNTLSLFICNYQLFICVLFILFPKSSKHTLQMLTIWESAQAKQ